MFTVKIINKARFENKPDEVTSVYLREWRDAAVWYPESQNYKDKVEALKQEVYNDYHDDLKGELKTGDELNALIDIQSTYKAFVTFENIDGYEDFYCIAELEEVYITDSNGNTVYSIR